ncbi:hypothetical protein GGX14DRAFT_559450 [Mycena pura]|uniref:Uncharacterized protein n=1 Tax=Mycena pura TaxID=153505 RepID=A0AAD6YHR0_9AGAR|nr:hypothetical protein GGX14DRAFT_559450 [Mycena pura]
MPADIDECADYAEVVGTDEVRCATRQSRGLACDALPAPAASGGAQPVQQDTLTYPWVIDDRDRADIAAANAVHAAPQPPLGLATGAVQVNLGAAAVAWAPIPPSGLPAVYGWDDERVFDDMSDRQITKWKAAAGPKVFAYVYDGIRHTEDNPVIESIKGTLARALNTPAPLVGPAEPRPSAPRSSPFVYLVRNITDAQAQHLLTRFCWATAGSTVFALPFTPPSCHFLGSIVGLLFAATTEHANEVAVLVARTIRDSHEAQSYLALVNDAYPAGIDPMAHFLASIRVHALNRAPTGSPPSIIWIVTGAPPSHTTASNRAWVRIVGGLSFASDMHYVGEMARPPLTCTGCKSLGHERDYCPFRRLDRWEIPNPSTPSSSQALRGGAYRRNGRGGGNGYGGGRPNGGGRGARGNANGYNNRRDATRAT